ncbi:phosphoketolase [Phaffia rhodozyma]|uniref:Phosphoketolase n=1 Tax=Phaffia rhodozyma TaxID=264483 RepID=A0A0F7SSW8_PHARH|nr:phosphoketolase [Phaffia rhodozyma]
MAPTVAQAEGGSFEHTAFDGSTAPKASSLDPALVNQLLVQLDPKKDASSVDLEGLLAFQKAANYIAAAQIFLRSNGLLEEELTHGNIKKRLLGHWGTCPGLNFVYAHTNVLISHAPDAEFVFTTGPGHGLPALMATLYLEGAISKFYPKFGRDKDGLKQLIRAFSFPGGFPSHVNAETPGSIHEGGELGYALAVAFGSVMDKPERINVVVVGDGESETGPTAAAWHAHKYLDPAESGAVLPVLHVNGFKISERTIPGTMDDLELACLYTGYGYQVRIVEYGANLPENASEKQLEESINLDMAASFKWAYGEIQRIQKAARGGNPITKPRWPLIILRSPKGWTGPARLKDIQMVGTWRAHQVPLPKAAGDDYELGVLKDWLESYGPRELFNTAGNKHGDLSSSLPSDFVNAASLRIIPAKEERRLGFNKAVYRGYEPLDLPDWKKFSHDVKNGDVSAMKAIGSYLEGVVENPKNQKSFRIFSPDELASNKLDGVFKHTHRNFQWDPETANNGGRVTEMLSEHTLQGLMQGYTLTGRTGLFPSYESFLGIVTTMVEQYAKFVKVAEETTWREKNPSLNYIETSTLWRQEHNGYSHQNPGFIGSLLALPSHQTRVYLPADANTAVSTIAHCLRSKNYVNLIVGSKNPTPCWLDADEAEEHCIAGASVWKKYSTDEGINPDVVLVGCGVEVTFEVIAASFLLQAQGVRVRVVNVTDLMILGDEGTHPHALSPIAFQGLFTIDKPVVFNFHGFPKDVSSLLFSRNARVGRGRFDILGYIEQGTTTSPWSMLRMNKASRFDVAMRAAEAVAGQDPNGRISSQLQVLQGRWKHALHDHEKYVLEHGDDPEWCADVNPEAEKK